MANDSQGSLFANSRGQNITSLLKVDSKEFIEHTKTQRKIYQQINSEISPNKPLELSSRNQENM